MLILIWEIMLLINRKVCRLDMIQKEETGISVKPPGYPGDDWRKTYSVPNRTVYARPDSPSMLVTHAGNLLLLADAVKRGLYTGDAENLYKEG